MPRPEKVQAVAEIKERLEHAQAVFLAEYAGLSVKQQQVLRRGLREGGAEFKVVKMSLARRAAAELELADLDELFLGPTGIAFADGDPVSAAKVLKDFAKENETFTVKGGLLGSEFLSPERISELADIESREVLLAKIAGLMQAPMANLAGLLSAMPRNLAYAMQQLVEKKEEAGGATEAGDEAPAASDESSDEEAPVEAPAAEEDSTDAEASVEEPEAAVEEEVAEEAAEVATEVADEATDAAASDEADEEPDADASGDDSADEAADAKASTDDGDDAKSVDEDPAEEAEEA